MQADSLQESSLSVYVQSVFLVFQVPETEHGHIFILEVPCRYGGDGLVEVRLFRAPALGALQKELFVYHYAVADGVHHGFGGSHGFPAVIFEYLSPDLAPDGFSCVPECHFEVHFLAFGGDEGSPMGHSDRVGHGQPYIAVYAASGIPAAGFFWIVYRDLDLVVTLLDERSQVGLPGSISVWPFGDIFPVAENLRPLHRTVDVQEVLPGALPFHVQRL